MLSQFVKCSSVDFSTKTFVLRHRIDKFPHRFHFKNGFTYMHIHMHILMSLCHKFYRLVQYHPSNSRCAAIILPIIPLSSPSKNQEKEKVFIYVFHLLFASEKLKSFILFVPASAAKTFPLMMSKWCENVQFCMLIICQHRAFVLHRQVINIINLFEST